jgi:hypothetical protein
METVRIRDPGWKKVGSGIRYKHPGSATLIGILTNVFSYKSYLNPPPPPSIPPEVGKLMGPDR